MAKLVATRASCLSEPILTDTIALRPRSNRHSLFLGDECKGTVGACTVVPETGRRLVTPTANKHRLLSFLASSAGNANDARLCNCLVSPIEFRFAVPPA